MTKYDATGAPIEALPPNAAQESGGNLDKIAAFTQWTQAETLLAILRELQILSRLLAQASNVSDADLAAMRSDPNFP